MATLSGKQALVTGATGFIGGHLTRRLVQAEKMQVRALVRHPASAQDLATLGVELVKGDLTNLTTLRPAVAGCQILFHAAAWVGEGGSKAQVWAVNVSGTENLVQAAHSVTGLERFVHLSSCAVYGSRQTHQIDEETPPRMRGALYADSKVAAEAVIFDAHRRLGLPVVAARASQVYGLGSPQFTIRPVQMIKAGNMVLVDGGRHYCKPVYIDNLIDGLILCAKVDAAVGQAINLTDGQPISWREFFGAYGRMLEVRSFPSVPYRLAWLVAGISELKAALLGQKASFNRQVVHTLRSNNSFSNQKAKRLLGWTPQVDFAEGMRRTEAWLRANGYLS